MSDMKITKSSGCVFLDIGNCPINDLIKERDELKDAVKEGKRLLTQAKGVIKSKTESIAQMRATYADIERYKARQKEKRNKKNRKIKRLKEQLKYENNRVNNALEKVMKTIYNELNCSICPIKDFCNHKGKCMDAWKKYLEKTDEGR